MVIPKAVANHNKEVVWSVYRSLLRATRLAFFGDESTLEASRKFARESFRNGMKEFKSGSVEAEQSIEHAKGVTQILRENVVQGAKKRSDEGPYKLRLHEEIERGDNETIRKLKGTSRSFSDMKK